MDPKPLEETTSFNSRGWRVLYTFLAGLLSGTDLTSGHSFFVEMGLYSSPLLLDYARYTYRAWWRKKANNIQKGAVAVILLMSILGVLRLLDVTSWHHVLVISVKRGYPVGATVHVGLQTIWEIVVAMLIGSTIVDWVITDTDKGASTVSEVEQFHQNLLGGKEPTVDG